MNSNEPVDELLKESFKNFSPDAPDIWQSIQQGVQASQATTAVAASKGLAVAIKLAIAVTTIAGITGTYLYIKNNKQTVESTQSKQLIMPQTITPNADSTIANNELPTTDNINTPAKPIAIDKNIKLLKTVKTEVVENKKIIEAEHNIPLIETLPVQKTEPTSIINTITSAPKKQEVEVKKAPSIIAPKEEVKQASKPVEPPFNPNSEDGFDKPIIPGSFSPNGDGVNDRFVVVIDKEQKYQLTIIDRSNKVVFESTDKNNTWDGRDYRTGNLCTAGTYLWFFTYQFKDTDKQHETKGVLTLF